VAEELRLVDPDHGGIPGEEQELVRRVHDDRGDRVLVVRDDGGLGVAVVDGGLEDLDLLPRDAGAFEPADELFGLAGEHRAADDLDPASGLGVAGDDVGFHGGQRAEGRQAGPPKLRPLCYSSSTVPISAQPVPPSGRRTSAQPSARPVTTSTAPSGALPAAADSGDGAVLSAAGPVTTTARGVAS